MSDTSYCTKCKRTLSVKNFYTYKNGRHCDMCKECLTLHVKNFEPDTFTWILEKFDVPYIEEEWNILRDRAYQKDSKAVGGFSVIGKYLSKMKLKQFSHLKWEDTERLRLEAEERARIYGTAEDIKQKELAEMEERYKNGEISEAQFLTYKEIKAPEPTFELVDGSITNAGTAVQTVAVVEIPDVGLDLTEEDKVFLAMKWGRLYSAADWVWLEQKYQKFLKSFAIEDEARFDQLVFICKTSLKMNQALDSGDIDSYQKLSKVYDAQMKAGKFTEAQKKEEKAEAFDCVGVIVNFAETKKGGGRIARHQIVEPLDIVDKTILKLKKYYNDLFKNDPTLSQQIEGYIKKRQIAEEMRRDKEKAKEQGLEEITLTNEDFIEYSEMKEQLKEENKALYSPVIEEKEDKEE